VEGPILGTVIFFVLREFLADLASAYLIILGVVAIAVMLRAPRGIWGYIADRFGWQLFPLSRRLVRQAPKEPPPRRSEASGAALNQAHP
jgi:branched-chain amino acid transport system permease protein